MRDTKIQCTIGPSCNSVRMLAALLEAGADGMRINLSHGSAASQMDKLENFRKASDIKREYACSIMYDLRGPEIRVMDVPGGSLVVEDGEILTLHCQKESELSTGGYYEGMHVGNTISVNQDILPSRAEVGTQILIDDGKIRLIVEDVFDSDIICHVDRGGTICSHKGVNIPDVSLRLDYLGDEDKADILFCIENNVDYIAGSFLRSGEDAKAIRDFLDNNGGERIGLIAKIETKEALSRLEEIVDVADQILIARGDLGVEIGIEKVPAAQKYITDVCDDRGKVVILATQLIESMTDSPVPTRAEVSDIANAVYDGVTDLLVTGETASGRYPVQVIETMDSIVRQAEEDMYKYI